MKSLTLPTLLASALVQALPLKTGNTWTWSVRPHRNDTTTRLVTGTVLGSARHDSGTAWKLVLRDSSQARSDTHVVVERPDKSQAWLSGTSLLPLELQPRNGTKLELRNAKPILAPWGLKAFIPDMWFYATGYRYEIQPSAGGRSNGWVEFTYGEIGATAAIPQGVWIDTVGPVLFRTFGPQGSEARMISHNRRAIDLTPYEPVPRRPKTGTVVDWEEFHQSGVLYPNKIDTERLVRHRWTLLEPQPDSSGWARWPVRDSSVDAAGRATDTILALRFPRRDWISAVRTGGCPTPADAWFTDWTDSVTPSGIVRSARTGSYFGGAGARISQYHVFERIGTDGHMDSVSCAEQNSGGAGSVYIPRSSLTLRTLVAFDGKRVRAPRIALGVFGAPRGGRGGDLRSLADLPPGLSLRWTDGRGRSGSLRAGEVGTLNRICPRGPVFLRATLPDGTAWSGSTFVP